MRARRSLLELRRILFEFERNYLVFHYWRRRQAIFQSSGTPAIRMPSYMRLLPAR